MKFASLPVINPQVPRGAPGSVIGVVSMFVEDTSMLIGNYIILLKQKTLTFLEKVMLMVIYDFGNKENY